MMNEKELSLEELNAHVDKYFEPNRYSTKSMTKESAGAEICAIYKVVRPILVKVQKFPFLSDKLKNVIKTFVTVLDATCPD